MIETDWLGRLPYGEALERQRTYREAVIAGRAPEVLWALEHDPVITTGRRGVADLPDEAGLAARGVALFHVERGGLATWHGPGQLVIYAIVRAADRGLGARGLVCALETGVITWIRAQGVAARRREGYPGIWAPSPNQAGGLDKICAIGLHFRHGVSMHGVALNLRPDLSGFGLITPCGIHDAGVTSLQRLLGDAPSPETAAPAVTAAMIAAINELSRVVP